MGIRQKALETAIWSLRKGVRAMLGSRAPAVLARIAEALPPVVDQQTRFGTIRLWCPGSLAEYRARTLLTKEPETIAWIDTFAATDVFWDIGANVGVYSLYAAMQQVTTLSFEPSAANYYVLNRNIEINDMASRVSAFCLAFNDSTRLDSLHMQSTACGGALNSFASPIDWRGAAFAPVFTQGTIGFGVDDFICRFDPPFPNHIKIDVDGNEDRIVRGAERTLRDPRVKSLSVELNEDRAEYCRQLRGALEAAGMKFVKRGHAAELEGTLSHSSYNYLFMR
jgi:FkbM family methyltransferase